MRPIESWKESDLQHELLTSPGIILRVLPRARTDIINTRGDIIIKTGGDITWNYCKFITMVSCLLQPTVTKPKSSGKTECR